MRQVFICDKCSSQYKTEEDAIYCEDHHRVIDLVSISYYDYGTGSRSHIPHRVQIKFSSDHGDFATYKLERYGFTPV